MLCLFAKPLQATSLGCLDKRVQVDASETRWQTLQVSGARSCSHAKQWRGGTDRRESLMNAVA